MRRAMAGGADALQCRYGVRDAFGSRRSTLTEVALGGWNVLRPRGRDRRSHREPHAAPRRFSTFERA
jgi:hypothetical protein